MRPTPRPALLLIAATAVALAVAPPAHARRTVSLRFPKFEVPPRSDREVCTFVALPTDKPFDIEATRIVNVGLRRDFTTHHFLLWAYQGKDLASFPPEGQIVDGKACLDFGPTDTNQRALIAGSQSPKLTTTRLKGTAQQIKPTVDASGRSRIGLILNSHWINSSDRPQKASVKIKLMAAKKHTVRQYLLPLFDVIANGFIFVPPHQVKEETWTWRPGGFDVPFGLGGGVVPDGPACVVGITSHMHKRGKLFTVNLMDGDQAHEPALLETDSYSDPPQVDFVPQPMLVTKEQGLRYTCKHDNGVTTDVKLGCEEKPGVAPGVSVITAIFSGDPTAGAAKRCSAVGPAPSECPATDPKYPGRTFTGNCVEANLVFGFTSDDDMCILPGAFYPANAQGNCDLSGLPILN
jgi:hypothetical protein